MQIRILKSDGQIEPYLHTKVLGSFNHALSHTGDCLYVAEQMAEAVTFYLYRQVQHGNLSTDEIHQMILTVLESMGYARAAAALNEHRLKRKLQRKRIDVIDDVARQHQVTLSTHWDKTCIVRDLISHHNMDRFLARAIASAVEEKILNMGVTKVRKSLIHQLVIADTESMLEANRQLAAI
ncbi:MAG: hypothetical protein ISS71_09130 [Phycisphaerae bacterium]|nr:hypothetical protein [Phycisphaerae bacterium]